MKSGRLRTVILLAFLSCCVAGWAQEKIEFYTTPTFPLAGRSVHTYAIDFPDSLAADTLYQVKADNGYPVSYHRKIRTSVCFDNKCRLLDIIIHWNPTGRYLGFELPPGEYLSKTEHEPFTYSEYLRLHSILSDPNSPLAGLSYNQLVPAKAEGAPDLDAVSSPTAKNLLEFVVEGAAFTTYKLWHVIHGITREEVRRLTAADLTPELLEDILNSNHVSDKIWGLNQRYLVSETTPEIRRAILSFLASAEYSLAEAAIQAIQPVDLSDPEFQQSLLAILDQAIYSLRSQIIETFSEAPSITPQARLMLADHLTKVTGNLVGTILQLFKEEGIQDVGVLKKVATLLESENAFISRQVFDFLKPIAIENKEIQAALRRYETREKGR